MSEYIEREKALEIIDRIFFSTDPTGDEQIGILKCRTAIREEIPAADVAEVMHDEWQGFITHAYIGCDEYGDPKWAERKFFVHRKCGRRTAIKEKYCPNCGAKMDFGR